MKENRYGFIDVRDIFDCPEFIGEKETVRKGMEEQMIYYDERNRKDGWTLDTVLDSLMTETTVRSDANA